MFVGPFFNSTSSVHRRALSAAILCAFRQRSTYKTKSQLIVLRSCKTSANVESSFFHSSSVHRRMLNTTKSFVVVCNSCAIVCIYMIGSRLNLRFQLPYIQICWERSLICFQLNLQQTVFYQPSLFLLDNLN